MYSANAFDLFNLVADAQLDYFAEACLASPGFASLHPDDSIGTLLHATLHAKRSDLALWLMHNGCDVNALCDYDYTPLHMAAVRGLVCATAELIKLSADVHALDSGGQTPLHKACSVRNAAITRLLIDAGSDVNARDTSGATPLELLFEDRGLATFIIARGGSLSDLHQEAA